MNSGVYGRVSGDKVPRNEGVPLADYDFMAVLTLHCMYQQYRLPGSKGYLVHTGCIPSFKEWIVAYMARLGCLGSQKRRRPSDRLWFHGSLDPALYVPAISAPWVKGPFGTHRLHTLCCGMNTGVDGQVWGALVPRNEGASLADYDFYGSLDTALYVMAKQKCVCCYVWGALVPAIGCVPVADYDLMAVWTPNCIYQPHWVRGSKGYLVHITQVPELLWNENRVYGLVWDAFVPTNKDVPMADYNFMVAWSLYCMYQQYWVFGSKGYLVH